MKLALLIVDVQNQFFEDPVTTQSLDRAIEYINAAIDLFRPAGLPIIAIQHMNEENGLMPGCDGFEVPSSIKLLPGDLRITKTYGNAFTKTELVEKLREMGIDTIVVTGFCAEYCVLSTCRGALDHDLTPLVLRGALASAKPENIRFVEEISDLVSYGALQAILKALG